MEARVNQTPRYLVTGTGKKLTVLCSQDMKHDAMYWYRQDPGLGLRLIYYSRNAGFTENGDIPNGYNATRKEKDYFHLTLESAGTNQTSLYLCASSLSTALHGQLLSAQKEDHERKEPPSWGGPTSSRRKIPSTLSVWRSPSLTPQVQGP